MVILRDKKIVFLAIAAILLITAGIVIGFINTPKAHFTMDINPSIQITTNQLNRVTKIDALNDDAKDLLSYYTKPQKNLEAVINDLLDLMVFTGYIHGGSDNLVMITVSDDSVDKAILDRVNQAISDYLAIKQISASIVNQTLEAPETTNAQGIQLTGREAVVEKIIHEDPAKTRDELMTMSLNDLIAYAGANQIAPDKLISVLMANDVTTVATVAATTAATTEPVTALSTTDATTSASESNPGYDISTFITLDRAKAIALSEVSGTIIKAELDYEDYYDDDSDDDQDQDDDDFPKYEIEIRKDNKLYEVIIHAITGKVIEVDLEDDDDSNDDDDSDDEDDDDEEDSRNTTISTVASTTTTSTQTEITRMTASEARQAVLNRFGGIIQKIEYAYDDTNPHYKGEALKDGSKVVFDLNARTKIFTKWDTENDNSWDDFESALPNMITLAQAANLTVARSEQSNTFVQKIAFNWDDSEPIYQGEAFNKGVKYSFEIYAYGGTFKKWDISRGDDTWEEKYYNVK